MSSRIPLPYSAKVLELFRNPKNMGKMKDPSAFATTGSLACGDMIAVYLKIRDDTIVDAKFESYGCAANIAAASLLTEMIKGKKLEEAWRISWKQLADELGGLPRIKYHCSVLAIGGLRRAIREYYKNREKPKWLPKGLSSEEKSALEEEELIKKMYGGKGLTASQTPNEKL
jgi:nitrogen fixation NifU-like protein